MADDPTLTQENRGRIAEALAGENTFLRFGGDTFADLSPDVACRVLDLLNRAERAEADWKELWDTFRHTAEQVCEIDWTDAAFDGGAYADQLCEHILEAVREDRRLLQRAEAERDALRAALAAIAEGRWNEDRPPLGFETAQQYAGTVLAAARSKEP